MNCDGFREQILTHLDGELPAAAADAARSHERDCADCRDRAAFERALEARVGSALLGDAPSLDVAEILRRARAGEGGLRRGRLLRLRRLVAAAAVLLVAVQAAWFFCIPPFECSYLQAVEAAADVDPEPDQTWYAEELPGVSPPAEIDGFLRAGEPQIVRLGYGRVELAVRARYERGGESFTVLWSQRRGVKPSFRRRTQRDGVDWWIAEENGQRLVAWMCSVAGPMCTVVGDLPEDRLVSVASGLREAER